MPKHVDSEQFDFIALGNNIRNTRESKGYTQKDLADKLFVSETHISNIENGKKRINLVRLAEISILLEVSMSELLDGTNKTSPEYKLGEFSSVLMECSPEQRQQLYEIAKTFPKFTKKDDNS